MATKHPLASTQSRPAIRLLLSKMAAALLFVSLLISCSPSPNESALDAKIAELPALPNETIGNLTIYRSSSTAFAEARAANTPILLDFYADWCQPCRLFEQRIVEDPKLNAVLDQIVVLKLDEADEEYRLWEEKSDFAEIRESLPLLALLDADGNLLFKSQETVDLEPLYTAIDLALSKRR